MMATQREIELAAVSVEDFAGRTGQRFLLYPAAGAVGVTGEPMELTLAEVRPGPSSGAGGGRQPFALMFTGPGGERGLAPVLHTLAHDEFVIRDLFIARVTAVRKAGEPEGCGHYEAVFS
jgi:hypothetical protein